MTESGESSTFSIGGFRVGYGSLAACSPTAPGTTAGTREPTADSILPFAEVVSAAENSNLGNQFSGDRSHELSGTVDFPQNPTSTSEVGRQNSLEIMRFPDEASSSASSDYLKKTDTHKMSIVSGYHISGLLYRKVLIEANGLTSSRPFLLS
jgi:hypothetical protein